MKDDSSDSEPLKYSLVKPNEIELPGLIVAIQKEYEAVPEHEDGYREKYDSNLNHRVCQKEILQVESVCSRDVI